MNKLLTCLVTASLVVLSGASAAQQLPAGITPAQAAQIQAALQGMSPPPAPAPAPPPAPAPASQATAAPAPDSTDNQFTLSAVPVFGNWLFQGKFAAESFTGFNPDYLINVNDQIDVRLWGAVDITQRVTVDPQGNIFLPKVGPIQVLNVRNGDLNERIRQRVSNIYRENISVYSTLAAAQPVRVFVGGNVRRPGLYPAFASDSLLHFIDLAGGIDTSGSFLDIRIMRGNTVSQRVNLYDFLLRGSLPATQFHDGDTIFVGPLRKTIKVTGLVTRPVQFEFEDALDYATLLDMAGLSSTATHAQITHNEGAVRQVQYLPIDAKLRAQPVHDGDAVQIVADRLVDQIVITVEGEYRGPSQYVVPYKATLKDLLAQIQFTDQSRRDSVQIFRRSIALRQKQMLDASLDKLQQSALTARSTTTGEAALRSQDAALMLQFIDRARAIQPKGQLVLGAEVDPSKISLEDGDLLHIPRSQNVIAVQGEVYLPNAFAWAKGNSLDDYVKQAGGLTQNASPDRILLLKPSGEVHICESGTLFGTSVEPGDEILVLPQVDTKHFEFAKDIVAIIYQIAVAAGVAVRL